MKIKYNLFSVIVVFSVLVSGGSSGALEQLGTEGYVQASNTNLFYQIQGDGNPILIVHGGPGLGHTYLQPQLFELVNQNQLIFYDQRGSGRSSTLKSSDPMITLKQFVSDLEAVRHKLGLKKFILMGHSWGGDY